VPLFIDQTGKTPEPAFLERLRPLGWGTRSTFQERFPSVAKIRNDYGPPLRPFINCKDFDEPQGAERASCTLLPRVEDLMFFLPIFVLLWRGKLVWKN
jgi:hypothetical protein